MPIDLGNLDDKNFDDLVAEALATAPIGYPAQDGTQGSTQATRRGWTDLNPSDPGVALVELLAWLTEMLLYRANRITEPSYRTFLKLLGGPPPDASPDLSIDDALRVTIKSLRDRFRAVTADDYEFLTLNVWPAWAKAAGLGQAACFRRVRCVSPTPPHVGVVVVPDVPGNLTEQQKHDNPWVAPDPYVLGQIVQFFDDRRLITTRVYATGVRYVQIKLTVNIHLRNDARISDFPAQATQAIAQYFHPWDGGADGRGWPFGRAVHASEAYAVLEGVPGIDFVDGLDLTPVDGSDAPRRIDEGGEVVMVRLEPHELPRIDTFQITLMERRNGTWQPIA